MKEIYKNFQILSYTSEIGPYHLKDPDETELWLNPKKVEEFPAYFPHSEDSKKIKEMLIQAKKEGQSYGGKMIMKIKGIPEGLGQPVFHKLKSDLTSALMGIGSVCSVLIGSENKPATGRDFHKEPSVYGGIRGGLSTGGVIELQTSFKPPSSIGTLAKEGRHDPCIAPRAVPVLESMAYLVIADHALAKRLDQV